MNEDNYTYEPKPVETENITLPADIMELAEILAEHTHDVWAKKRIEEGWSYGSERNDSEKKHPCLVPYDELPESEKEYDRQVSIQVLKVLYGKGYKILKED